MRKVFRDKENTNYWENRWVNSGVDVDGFKNEEIYPIKYAKKIVSESSKILEAGCGAGRVYFHYKKLGYNIKGIEYSRNAVSNILQKDPNADVIQGSISNLPYKDNSFNAVLAFGLYHNIEDLGELQKSFEETYRILEKGGRLVFSVRFDSLENNMIENIVRKRAKGKTFDKFHRWHFSLYDMKNLLGEKMKIEKVYTARNVSFLFKYNFFRDKNLKSSRFQESEARSSGFKLNFIGNSLDNTLHCLFPNLFSNLLVIIAKKD